MRDTGARVLARLLAETPEERQARMDRDVFGVYGGHCEGGDVHGGTLASATECDGAAADEWASRGER